MDYTVFDNLRVRGILEASSIAAVMDDADIVEADKAAGDAPTKAEFDALVDVVNALTAALGRE